MAKVSRNRRKVGVDKHGEPIYRDEGWKVRYVDPDGVEHTKKIAKKADADRFATEVEHTKLVGSYVDPRAGQATFKEYAEAWRAAQPHRSSTRVQLESRLRLHVYPAIGSRPLAAIRSTELKALIRDRERVLAAATVENVAGWVASIFNAAVEDRLIAVSPVRKGTLDVTSTTTETRLRLLNALEVDAVTEEMPGRWRAMVPLAVGTGLRSGEVLGLTVDRVDFLRRTLTVDRQLVTVVGEGPVLAPPKTAASNRTIPLPAYVIDALAAHLAEYPASDDGLLFTTGGAAPIRRGYFYEVWAKVVERARLAEGTGFHDLRHTYASALIAGGCSVKVVQKRLGHASAMETLDTYGHLWPDDDDRTRAAIDEAFGSRSDQDRTKATDQR